MQRFDCIVAGCGAVGSAAAYHLARRGHSVLAIDRFPPGHDRGSSHGETRVIRQAYFEHPAYVPLLRRAYTLWEALQEESGQQLYHETGVLEIGSPEGEVVPGVLAAAEQHDLPVERVAADDFHAAFPGFVLPPGAVALLERRGGYLRVEAAVRAHAELARAAGATLAIGETVTGFSSSAGGVAVETSRQRYEAGSLLLTAGAWSADLLGSIGLELTVLRKHLHWFANDVAGYREDQGCPVFFYELGDRCFYGFPQRDGLGVKVSEHTGGEPVASPDTLSKAVDPQDRTAVAAFLRAHLPGVGQRVLRHDTCMYTMSPDGHFIVDGHPEHDHVYLAAGLSGHGFKFATVLGELLAGRALGERDSSAAFLGLARFQQREPRLCAPDAPPGAAAAARASLRKAARSSRERARKQKAP